MAALSWYICSSMIGHREAASYRLEEDCERYVRKAVPAILEKWDFEAWRSRCAGELLETLKMPRERRRFKDYKALFGEFRHAEEPRGSVVSDTSAGIVDISGYYTVPVRFSRGRADVTMKLIKRAGGWKFQRFMLRSDLIDSATDEN